jgi:hypothetical protein
LFSAKEKGKGKLLLFSANEKMDKESLFFLVGK